MERSDSRPVVSTLHAAQPSASRSRASNASRHSRRRRLTLGSRVHARQQCRDENQARQKRACQADQ
jgi:hypothetical protein